ncbi:hypothetical protein [Ornithinimicrobium cavernae]|uniref:hypothetical protein n=1 Tax=Ornithinimicrobium cavernae TaxID=2666047 RepID=UPI000D69D44C|nr:hypothetical protein [Ornithinimicrobium cavernae]
MTVTDPGWVDTDSFRPNRGQFPIRVEQHLNRFVSFHLPGVTTVTSATRYYALHGLTAYVVAEEALDEPAAVNILRRSEALLAYVTHVHEQELGSEHPWSPAPHGIDKIRTHAVTAEGVDLSKAAEHYAEAKWAFLNPYRGSEMFLDILQRSGGFKPGERFDPAAARSVLVPLLETARSQDAVSREQAAALSAACLCTTSNQMDGAWLAELLSGDKTASTDPKNVSAGRLLWEFGHLTAVATQVGDVTDASALSRLIMFDPELAQHPALLGQVAPERWRGALFRKESVWALRLIWHKISNLVEGASYVADLMAAFADLLPDSDTVGSFRGKLPHHLRKDGGPREAERELEDRTDVERWLGTLMLGAARLPNLSEQELQGFRAAREHEAGQWDELSPGWFQELLELNADMSLRDFGVLLARQMINRSQRVALGKSRFHAKTQVFSYPARLHVRDGVAVRLFGETAPEPATRIPQYLSIARQAGMFTVNNDGKFAVGKNGERLA